MAQKKLTLKSLMDKIVSRPKPSAPRAGYKASGSRYENRISMVTLSSLCSAPYASSVVADAIPESAIVKINNLFNYRQAKRLWW